LADISRVSGADRRSDVDLQERSVSISAPTTEIDYSFYLTHPGWAFSFFAGLASTVLLAYMTQGKRTFLLFRWINEVRKQLKALVTGSLVLGGLGLYQEISGSLVPWWAYTAITVVFLVWALFGAWKQEYLRSEATERKAKEIETRLYDTRPVFVLDIRFRQHRTWEFVLRNVGGRTARFVKLEQQISGQARFMLNFREILALPPTESSPVNFWVTDSSVRELLPILNDSRMLAEFVADNPSSDDPAKNTALTWWDIPIRFRDTDESVQVELVRLCYDVESGVLYATAPPYTERGFTARSDSRPEEEIRPPS
jgi:hypothetical protein